MAPKMADDSMDRFRSQSSSAVDDARVERERVFRLRADKPLHRPRDPWKVSAQVWNCFGIWNWTVLILVLVALKMFLENINKFGLQIDFSLWTQVIFGKSVRSGRSDYPVTVLLFYINVCLAVALKTETYLAKNVIEWRTGLSIHVANIAILLSMPVKFINLMPEQIGLCSSVFIVTAYTCLFMKLVSYIQVNKWCRDAMIDSKNLGKRNRLWSRRENGDKSSPSPTKSELKRAFYARSPLKLSPSPLKLSLSPLKLSLSPLKLSPTAEHKSEASVRRPNRTERHPIDENNNVEADLNHNETVEEKKTTEIFTTPKKGARSTPRIRRISQKASKRDSIFEANPKRDVIYPDNLTFRDIYFFWFLPTLCYEVNFPRTRRIRTGFLVNRAVEVFVCSNICICIIQQYIVPSVAHILLPFYKMELSLVAERLLKLALPNHLLWLIIFYVFFHSFLNTSAEIMQFADRSFFRDWWNAPNLEVFWKTWNLPVHRWCVRHVYKPMLATGFSKSVAMSTVFLLSALLHEYLISVPLRMFHLGVALGMLAQIPLVHLSRFLEQKFGARIGNMMVWGSLIIGQPLIIMMYYHDYVIQNYGQQIESWIESETCQC